MNPILPILFTLRGEESKIIAVMSSNVDDFLYGYLLVGAEATNSVLQQFLVGREEQGIFRFCGKKFRQDEDFGIRVTAKDNTEQVQSISYDAKHGLTRMATANEVHHLRSVTQSLASIARQTRPDLFHTEFRRYKALSKMLVFETCVSAIVLSSTLLLDPHMASIFLKSFLGMMQSL